MKPITVDISLRDLRSLIATHALLSSPKEFTVSAAARIAVAVADALEQASEITPATLDAILPKGTRSSDIQVYDDKVGELLGLVKPLPNPKYRYMHVGAENVEIE